MKSILALIAACAVGCGCANINMGSMQVPSFGKNVTISNVSYSKSGTNETLEIKGLKSDSTESTHATANVAMGIVGAVAGMSAGPAGAAAGGAAGMSVTEIWQSFSDWLNNPKTTPPAEVVPPAASAPSITDAVKLLVSAPEATGVLVDPPYNQAYMDAKGSWEEVGLEQSKKVIIRCCVWRPTAGDWWMLSTPFMDHVRRVGDTTVVDPSFVFDGYRYTLRGWLSTEPKPKEANPTITSTAASAPWGTKYTAWNVTKAQ